MYCEFSECHNELIKNSGFIKADVDKKSCSLNDLEISLNALSLRLDASENVIEDAARKFFSSFYRGSSFRDNNKVHIQFSNKIKGLNKSNFNKLLLDGYFSVSKAKNVDTFYCISEHFKSSVRKFINDGYKDRKIRGFISSIKL